MGGWEAAHPEVDETVAVEGPLVVLPDSHHLHTPSPPRQHQAWNKKQEGVRACTRVHNAC